MDIWVPKDADFFFCIGSALKDRLDKGVGVSGGFWGGAPSTRTSAHMGQNRCFWIPGVGVFKMDNAMSNPTQQPCCIW